MATEQRPYTEHEIDGNGTLKLLIDVPYYIAHVRIEKDDRLIYNEEYMADYPLEIGDMDELRGSELHITIGITVIEKTEIVSRKVVLLLDDREVYKVPIEGKDDRFEGDAENVFYNDYVRIV